MSELKLAYREVDFNEIEFGDRAREDYGDIEDLAISIERYGLMTPLTVIKQKEGGYLLLAGGRRYRALEFLEWTEQIPVLIKAPGVEIEQIEVELFENIMRKGLEWPEQVKLVAKINKFYEEKEENWKNSDTAGLLGRSTGSISEQLQLAEAIKVIPKLSEAKTEKEAKRQLSQIHEKIALKELEKRRTKNEEEGTEDVALGKVLKKANTRYKIGDVFDGLAKMKDEDKNIFLIEVDPPYGIDLKGQKRPSGKSDLVDDYVEISDSEYETFLEKLTKELYRVSASDAIIVFWLAINRYEQIAKALQDAGFIIDIIPCIWSKKQGQTNQKEHRLARTYEVFIYGYKDKTKSAVFKEGRSNVFEFTPVYGPDKYHPTQRPVPLIKEILETFGAAAQGLNRKVLIPFLGSGASIIAASELKLESFGWDINGEYKEKYLLEVTMRHEDKYKIK